MQNLNNNSEAGLDNMMDQNGTLRLIEYASAVAAVAGTIVTGVTSQAVFAAAPLTLSVILNLFNRQQLAQLTRQSTFADTTEVQRRLSAEVQSLRSQVEDLPAYQERSDYNDVKVSITSLSASVSTLEQQMMDAPAGQPLEAINAIEAEINQLREYQIDLTHSIEALQGQISGDPEAVGVANNMHQELATLKNTVAQLSPSDGADAANLESLRAELEAMLAPVQQQVSDLSTRIDQQGGATEGTPLSGEQFTQVSDQIEDVKVKMDTMLANISEEMEIARGAMENTQHQVNEVQQQLSVVREETANTPSGVNPDDLHQQVQAAIGPLQDQIGQLESRITALPTIDANVTQGQEEQLQGLQHHLQDLSNRLETISSQFSTEMANLPNMVDEQVQNRVGELRGQTVPQVDEGGLQDRMSELDSLLADLS